jgi:cell wall-associated NlpC family hydrolase
VANHTSPVRTNILSIQMLTINREDVIAEARKWIGTRWRHQGRSQMGVDCAGLVVLVGQTLGLPATDMLGYRRSPDGVLFRQHIVSQTTFEAQPRAGSIGLFREARFPTHTGIFATDEDGHLTLIHAYLPHGKVVEERFIHEWPEKLVAVRNYIGLND